MRVPTLIALLLFVMSVSAFSQPQLLDYEVIGEREHPHKAFTQGLLIHQGQFVESSGLYRQSFVQRYPVNDGAPAVIRHQPRRDFSEGLAFTGEHFWLITWQQGIARKLDTTLKPLAIARYQGEGWGLTFNDEQLIMSNGSARLQFRHPVTFELQHEQTVTVNGEPLNALNELEWVNGIVWANVWFSSSLYAIAPHTGEVIATLDLSALAAAENRGPDAVLNGIAYDQRDNTLWITGKRWQKLYQLHIAAWPQIPDAHKPIESAR